LVGVRSADVAARAEFAVELFGSVGFAADEVVSHRREIVNRREQVTMDRTWLQCRFVKTADAPPAAAAAAAAGLE
jgi:hypothetical protein